MRWLARFNPQAWVGDWPLDVKGEGETVADVTSHMLALSEVQRAAVMVADDYPSDDVRFWEGVPGWWADWSGPFYIEVVEED